MKKVIVWSMLMLAILTLPMVVACGGDDDGTPSDPNRINFSEAIIGSWNITKWVDNFTNSERENVKGTFVFRKDGSFTISGDVTEIFDPENDSTYDEITGTYYIYQDEKDSQLGTVHLDLDKIYKESGVLAYKYENLKVKIYKDGVFNMTFTQDKYYWDIHHVNRTLYFKRN